jgi:hypothetical protein
MKDFKIKGTKLPTIPVGTEYRVVDWYDGNQFTSFEKINLVSYGIGQYGGEDYILADYSHYGGDQFYMFKLKDIERLAAEQSLMEQSELTSKTEENMVKIKREQLLEIHNIACPTWKRTIEQLAIKSLFGTEIELTQAQVDEMFKAATSTQVPTLEKIFGKQLSELDFRSEDINLEVDNIKVFGGSNMSVADSFIGLPRNEGTKDMFFLNPHYTWTLDGCELTVTRKS